MSCNFLLHISCKCALFMAIVLEHTPLSVSWLYIVVLSSVVCYLRALLTILRTFTVLLSELSHRLQYSLCFKHKKSKSKRRVGARDTGVSMAESSRDDVDLSPKNGPPKNSFPRYKYSEPSWSMYFRVVLKYLNPFK